MRKKRRRKKGKKERKKERKKEKSMSLFGYRLSTKCASGYKIQDNFINPFRKLHGLP